MRKSITVESGLTVNLYPLGDTHIGSMACDEDRNIALASIIANDQCARVLGLGDYIEAIAPSDKRWSVRELPDYADTMMLENLFYRQAMRFCKIYEATSGRWDALIRGNHEQTAIARFFSDPCAIIAERMRAAYVGDHNQSAWVRYLLKDEAGKTRGMVNVWIAHGWAGGELKGGTALALQRALLRKSAQVVILAHSHQPMAFPETVELLGQGGIVKSEVRWGIVTFPMIDLHGYMARRGGNPCPAGYSVIRITASLKNEVDISVEQKTIK